MNLFSYVPHVRWKTHARPTLRFARIARRSYADGPQATLAARQAADASRAKIGQGRTSSACGAVKRSARPGVTLNRGHSEPFCRRGDCSEQTKRSSIRIILGRRWCPIQITLEVRGGEGGDAEAECGGGGITSMRAGGHHGE